MTSIFFVTWMATVVPNRHQYYCKLEWVERKLCYYWCANETRGFNWFEPETRKGCKIRKKFYKT